MITLEEWFLEGGERYMHFSGQIFSSGARVGHDSKPRKLLENSFYVKITFKKSLVFPLILELMYAFEHLMW